MQAILNIRPDPPEEKPDCIWKIAGVVRQRACNNEFICHECRFNHALEREANRNDDMKRMGKMPQGRRGRIVHWRRRMMSLPVGRRPCLHHLRDRIQYRPCTNAYRCADCEFNQYFLDQHTVHAVMKPVSLMRISGFGLPQGVYLDRSHVWMKMEESQMVRIGLDDFAFRLLGPPDRLVPPLIGKMFRRGDAVIHLHRDNYHVDIPVPVTGVVTDINPRIAEDSQVAFSDPYGDGWIMRMHVRDIRSDLKHLLLGEDAAAHFQSDIDRLYEDIEDVMPLAADGGYLGKDVYGSLPELGWQQLVGRYIYRER
jgi:glycine cleavage system H lipoate-binding protein